MMAISFYSITLLTIPAPPQTIAQSVSKITVSSMDLPIHTAISILLQPLHCKPDSP